MNLLTFFLDYFEQQYFILKLKPSKIEMLNLYKKNGNTFVLIILDKLKYLNEKMKLLGLEDYKCVYIF